MSTDIYFIRHCEAAGNKEHFFQGRTDSGISERGARQLGYLAERFRAAHIDALYSSPLKRAMLTAEAVNKYPSLTITTDDRLMELDGGIWEGKRWAELPELDPEQSYNWIKAPALFRPEGGESFAQVYARMAEAATDIAARHDGQAVAVCTHGCAIRCLICWAMGYAPWRISEIEWVDNCSVTLLRVSEGAPRIEYLGDTSHIPQELSTFAGQSWWKNKDGMNFADDG